MAESLRKTIYKGGFSLASPAKHTLGSRLYLAVRISDATETYERFVLVELESRYCLTFQQLLYCFLIHRLLFTITGSSFDSKICKCIFTDIGLISYNVLARKKGSCTNKQYSPFFLVTHCCGSVSNVSFGDFYHIRCLPIYTAHTSKYN